MSELKNTSVEQTVIDLIIAQLGIPPEKVTLNSSFIDDLGADSLDVVELIMALEDEFDIEIPDDDAGSLKTVKDVSDYIERHKQ